MHIGLDFDGVIADTYKLKHAYLKKKFNLVLKDSELGKPALTKRITPAAYSKMISQIYAKPIMLKARIVPGAKKCIAQLRKNNVVYIITSRTALETKMANLWLQKNNIHVDKIIHTSNKNKTAACKKYNIALYVDDSEPILNNIHNKKTRRVLLQKPYNKRANISAGIQTAKTFSDVLKIVKLLKGRSD